MSVDLAPPALVRLGAPVQPVPPPGHQSPLERGITALIVVGPFLAAVYAALRWWHHGIALRDVVLVVLFYVLLGHGLTVGFHRLFADRSFVANRPLKVALAILGSMAFEGGPIGWVADHRRHHAFSDRDGDPHSPVSHGTGLRAQLRGLWHAHVGWLFHHSSTAWDRYAGDLLRDRDLVVINQLFPLWCVVSLALPFAIGWWLAGLAGGLTALLWAGGVRIFLLHHITWSVNSICHTVGRRPFPTADHSTNVAALAVLSLGESWHNGHHAHPRSSRHGVLPRQCDSSALVIAGLERLGWATEVHTTRRARL